jgi:hypothetical protein
MRFVTEEELRDEYKGAPFSSYTPKDGTRLTPGARQFLMDRGLLDYEDELPFPAPAGAVSPAKPTAKPASSDADSKRFYAALEDAKIRFYRAGIELSGFADIAISQRITALGTQLARLKTGADISHDLGFAACTGIKSDNFSDLLEDCFEIGEFHVQGENGRVIVTLHGLRTGLRLLELSLNGLCLKGSCDETRNAAVRGVHEIINILSRMICAAFGSQVCQKC